MKNVNDKIKRGMLAVGGLCFASALASVSLSAAAAKIEGLELLDRLGERPAQLSVYRVQQLSPKELSKLKSLGGQLADKAGVKFGSPFELGIDDSRTALIGEQDPSATFEIDRVTGGFLFSSGIARYREDGHTKDLPLESDAEALAHRALKQYGLSVDAKQLRLLHIGGLNLGVTTGAGDSTIYEKLRTVKFGRTVDGLAVEGDSRIVVQLAEGGELAGMVFQWPELKADPLDASQLQQPEAMKQRALEQIDAVIGESERSILSAVDLVLYDDGKGVVEPAYHIVVERYFDFEDAKQATMIPYDFYIPATLKPVAFYPYMDQAPLAIEDKTE